MKAKILLVSFILSIALSDSHSQQNTNGWYWSNGKPQSNTLNWAKIIDATHYYAVGENGTFMKSSDGGDTWLINTQAGVTDPSFGSGGTLRLYSAWFFNANTGILVGQSVSGDGGKIRRTTDGGETFTTINLGIPSGLARTFDIYFINSTTGFICGNSTVGAFKTTNAGLSWTLLTNLPVLPSNYLCVFATDVNNIYLGLQTDGYQNERRIVRTSDGGSTWKIDTLPGSTIATINDIKFLNTNTGFACGELASSNDPGYFVLTTNGGTNWTQINFPNKHKKLYELKIIGSAVYVLGGHIYRSTNSGTTWDSVNYSDPSNVYQPYGGGLSFSINGNDEIIVGPSGQLNISNDGGTSWRNKNYAVGNSAYCFSSVFALKGTQGVWAGTNGGGRILRSTNGGTNWTQTVTGTDFQVYDIQMLNSNTGYAAGGSLFYGTGYCFKTTNGGVSWSSLPIPTPLVPIYGGDFVNVNTGWITGGYPFGSPGVISKTTNGGSTWITQSVTPVYNAVIGSVDMVDANTGYCTGGANVWKTTNGGTNWDKLNTLPPSLTWGKVQTFSANTLYLGGGQRIYKSSNGGAAWDSAFIPSSQPNIFNMDWFDLNNGTIVGTAGYTAKTKDGGATWVERNPGSSTLTGVSMSSKDTVYAVCDRNVWAGIFKLTDNPVTVNLNITAGIQGFWDGTSQITDTVICHLRNSVSPFNEIDAVASVLNSSGSGNFSFSNLQTGSYYIEISHRNSIETWSSNPVSVNAVGNYSYNFTTSAAQSFGANTFLSSGLYCFYSGDVNQDATIDAADLASIENGQGNSGYLSEDLSGDDFVDGSDLALVENNQGVLVIQP